MVGVLVFGLVFVFGSQSCFGLAPAFGWGLVFVFGLAFGWFRGRIRGGCHGYGVHGHSQKHGGLAVNINLLGVLVGLQEGE